MIVPKFSKAQHPAGIFESLSKAELHPRGNSLESATVELSDCSLCLSLHAGMVVLAEAVIVFFWVFYYFFISSFLMVLIFQAFSKVDTHKQGSIHLSDIKKFFNANCPYKPGSGRFQDHACFICVLLITGRNPLSVNFYYLCTKKVVAYLAQE